MSIFQDLGKKMFGQASGLVSRSEGGRDYFASATNMVNTMVKGKTPRELVKPGNVIQFVSRLTGHSIQIVFSHEHKQLVCDTLGGVGPGHANADWEVLSPDNVRFAFRNQNNYLGMVNGFPVIIPLAPQQRPPPQAEFRVLDIFGMAQAVHLESIHMPGYFLCFHQSGARLDGTEFMKNERVAHFEVVLISSGNGIPPGGLKSPPAGYTEAAPPSYREATGLRQGSSRAEEPGYDGQQPDPSRSEGSRHGSSRPEGSRHESS